MDEVTAGWIGRLFQGALIVMLPDVGQAVDDDQQIPVEVRHQVLGCPGAAFSLSLDSRGALGHLAVLHVGNQAAIDKANLGLSSKFEWLL